MNTNAEPIALSIEQAHQWLREHGFDYSLRQVKRMAWEEKLPFNKQPTGRDLFIWDADLRMALKMPSTQ